MYPLLSYTIFEPAHFVAVAIGLGQVIWIFTEMLMVMNNLHRNAASAR